jgi:hypothetical protein
VTEPLDLRDVTLCAVTSVNISQTLMAMEQCVRQINFGSVLLLTDVPLAEKPDWLETRLIRRLNSSADYSRFMLEELVDHIRTNHVLLVQWDGFVIDSAQWEASFTGCDYVGASWPQFVDDHQVGNGGFSLRSRRLLEACRDPRFKGRHPEDVCICRDNRTLLEKEFGIVFADKDLADRFSFERFHRPGATFGFHGVFNMIEAAGLRYFLTVYDALDDKRIVFLDYWLITRAVIRHARELRRKDVLRLLAGLFFGYLGYRLNRARRASGKIRV